jgi:hypothetical protein
MSPEPTAQGWCINCGDETDGGTVCSAGCGYAVTGEYPDLYEKDYGDDE